MIEIQSLQKVVEQRLIIDISALRVEAGEVAAVVGAVDSGVDTLLDLIVGRAQPTVGQVRVAGCDPLRDRREVSQKLGVLFAEDCLYTHRTAHGNLAFFARLYGLPRPRTEAVLSEVGLLDHAQVLARNLSPGLSRRLAYGRAILHEPGVLLLMDPFARCDGASIGLLRRLTQAQAERGTAVLILARDGSHLGTLCDVIHTIERGSVVDSRDPREDSAVGRPFKVPVRMEDKVVLINPGDIRYALAREGRAYLATSEQVLPTQFTLADLEERLAPSGFFRAHRGYLVNLQHVKEVIPYTRNSFSLVLDDEEETEIPLSKSAARDLREMLGY